jgi:leucyl-tRNA synthetase
MTQSIHQAEFPAYDTLLAKDDVVTIGVQINGKVRGDITLRPDATQAEAMELVAADASLVEKVGDATITKIIYVPGRILNILQK